MTPDSGSDKCRRSPCMDTGSRDTVTTALGKMMLLNKAAAASATKRSESSNSHHHHHHHPSHDGDNYFIGRRRLLLYHRMRQGLCEPIAAEPNGASLRDDVVRRSDSGADGADGGGDDEGEVDGAVEAEGREEKDAKDEKEKHLAVGSSAATAPSEERAPSLSSSASSSSSAPEPPVDAADAAAAAAVSSSSSSSSSLTFSGFLFGSSARPVAGPSLDGASTARLLWKDGKRVPVDGCGRGRRARNIPFPPESVFEDARSRRETKRVRSESGRRRNRGQSVPRESPRSARRGENDAGEDGPEEMDDGAEDDEEDARMRRRRGSRRRRTGGAAGPVSRVRVYYSRLIDMSKLWKGDGDASANADGGLESDIARAIFGRATRNSEVISAKAYCSVVAYGFFRVRARRREDDRGLPRSVDRRRERVRRHSHPHHSLASRRDDATAGAPGPAFATAERRRPRGDDVEHSSVDGRPEAKRPRASEENRAGGAAYVADAVGRRFRSHYDDDDDDDDCDAISLTAGDLVIDEDRGDSDADVALATSDARDGSSGDIGPGFPVRSSTPRDMSPTPTSPSWSSASSRLRRNALRRRRSSRASSSSSPFSPRSPSYISSPAAAEAPSSSTPLPPFAPSRRPRSPSFSPIAAAVDDAVVPNPAATTTTTTAAAKTRGYPSFSSSPSPSLTAGPFSLARVSAAGWATETSVSQLAGGALSSRPLVGGYREGARKTRERVGNASPEPATLFAGSRDRAGVLCYATPASAG